MKNEPFILKRESCPAYWLAGTLWNILGDGRHTNNRITLIEQLMGAGLGPTTHRHPHNSEGFYILEGKFSFNAYGKQFLALPGTFIYIPRMLPHSFSVVSTEARAINFYMPSCFEAIVMSLGKPAFELRRPSMEESAPPQPPEQIQILSDIYGQEKVTALPFAVPPSPELMVTYESDKGDGKLLIRNTSNTASKEKIEMRALVTAAETNGEYDLYELNLQANETYFVVNDEALYIIAGVLTISWENEKRTAASGIFGYLPTVINSCLQADSIVKLLIFKLFQSN